VFRIKVVPLGMGHGFFKAVRNISLDDGSGKLIVVKGSKVGVDQDLLCRAPFQGEKGVEETLVENSEALILMLTKG
jgi:hypothetical protein